jgi:hypothetical protein
MNPSKSRCKVGGDRETRMNFPHSKIHVAFSAFDTKQDREGGRLNLITALASFSILLPNIHKNASFEAPSISIAPRWKMKT